MDDLQRNELEIYASQLQDQDWKQKQAWNAGFGSVWNEVWKQQATEQQKNKTQGWTSGKTEEGGTGVQSKSTSHSATARGKNENRIQQQT